MTEREKMILGHMYDAYDEELTAARERARQLAIEFFLNTTSPISFRRKKYEDI